MQYSSSLRKQVLEAEAVRDDEMARLEARHARDKQLISALKLKVERLEMELMRAEDVPQHEAESYLDLLGGGAGAGISKGFASRKNRNAISGGRAEDAVDSDEDADDVNEYSESDGEMDEDGAISGQNDDDEKSMRDLVQEQDALNGTWTKQMMEKEDKRRKAFAKKRKQQ